jgi:hypothetical protein
MPVAPQRTPLAEESAAAETALLVIDMFSRWDFPDAQAPARAATRVAPRAAHRRPETPLRQGGRPDRVRQ